MRGLGWTGNSELLAQDCYWVADNQMLAGTYPGPGSRFGSERKIRHLLTGSIDCFLDLTMKDEFPSYAELITALALELGRGHVTILRRPLVEHSVPTAHEMRRLLDDLDAELKQGRRIFVHCHYGVGRTGMVVGCWLIRHRQATKKTVLDHIAQLRSHLKSPWHSPQMPIQRHWVTEWPAGA